MKQGTLFYDKENGRYDFCYDCDRETINYGGIHCGEVFELCLNDVWAPARAGMYEDWYLVGLPGSKMGGLEVGTRQRTGQWPVVFGHCPIFGFKEAFQLLLHMAPGIRPEDYEFPKKVKQ